VDPKTGSIEKVNDEAGQPNGVCFSPGYRLQKAIIRRPQRRRHLFMAAKKAKIIFYTR
jgi:hypothetical protein